MVRLQRPLIVLDTIRHDGTSRPSSARVAPVHTVRALPLHMPPPPPALPLRPPSARTEPALAPSPPSRPMTARAQTRGHRPVSGRAMSLRPDSSPGVRRSSIGPRGSPRLSRERSPGINEQLGAASSSVGGRCMDVWDGDGPTPPLPDVAEGTAQSSTFMTGFGDEAAVPQRAHRRRSQDVAAPVVSGMAGIADLALPSVEKPWTERDRAKASLRAMLDMSAEEYVELAFEAGSHSIFDFDDEDPSGPAAKMLNAARAFDQRHKRYSGAVRHHLLQLEVSPADGEQRRLLNRRLIDLRRNRYYTHEKIEHAKRIRGRRRKIKWSLETSCWAGRKADGNSKDFFETSDAMRRMFNVDWAVASKAHNLSWFIVKSQRDPTEWKSIDKKASFEEVKEVKEALWQHYKLIYGAYDYYSMLYTDDGDGPEEPDLFNITFASYMNFCEHNGMVSKKIPAGEFEVIWSIVNAKDRALNESEDKHNKDKALNRQEFLQSLVRCAVNVYVQRGVIHDVSDAVNRLCSENMMRNMSKRCPSALQSSNAFRTRFCYIEATSLVLEANIKSLRALYDNYAEVSRVPGDELRDDSLMSIGEWLTFIKQMGLVESRQLTASQAKQIFLWSRIRSVDSNSDKQETRLRHLFFEDFLEALVRMATMLALPTNIEIEDVNARNAGEFLLALQADDPQAYREFIETHRPRHQDADGSDFDAEGTGLKGLFQPVWIGIKHVIDLLVFTVEFNTSARRNETNADGVVQVTEAAQFIKQRSSGKELHLRTGSLAGADWRMAQDKAVFTAAAIKIQLASRAKKAKKQVAERRKKTEEVQQQQEEADSAELLEASQNAIGA